MPELQNRLDNFVKRFIRRDGDLQYRSVKERHMGIDVLTVASGIFENIQSGSGHFSDRISLDEIVAPAGDPSADTGWIYAKDYSGVSHLYWEADDGSVRNISASGHELLTNLEWSTAGHTIDADIVPTASGMRNVGTQEVTFLSGNFNSINADTGAFTTVIGGTVTDGTASIAGGVVSGATNTNWDAAYVHRSSDGSDHGFIDQDVANGSAPVFTVGNFSDGGFNAIITATQETNFETAYIHSQDNAQAHSDYLINTGDTVAGDLTPDASGTRKIGTTSLPFASGNFNVLRADNGYFTDIHIGNSSLYLGSTQISADAVGNVQLANNLDMGTNKITSLLDPVENQDGATKKYVDDSSSPSNHNDLGGLQGGQTGQYYHLNSTQHSKIDAEVLIIENRTSDPSDPAAGRTWFRSDI